MAILLMAIQNLASRNRRLFLEETPLMALFECGTKLDRQDMVEDLIAKISESEQWQESGCEDSCN